MKKLSITSNYTFRHNPLFSQGSNDRNTYLPDTLYKYYQSTYGIASQNAQSGRLGLEYNFNKFSRLLILLLINCKSVCEYNNFFKFIAIN